MKKIEPNETNRLAIVRDLLELSKPLEEIIAQLVTLNCDYEGHGVELTRNHLAMALRRYLQGELSDADIESWANQIEGREDIQFETDSEQEIEDVLYELANPLLTEALSLTRAKALIEKLNLPT